MFAPTEGHELAALLAEDNAIIGAETRTADFAFLREASGAVQGRLLLGDPPQHEAGDNGADQGAPSKSLQHHRIMPVIPEECRPLENVELRAGEGQVYPRHDRDRKSTRLKPSH